MMNEMKVVRVNFKDVDGIAFDIAIREYVRNSTEFKAVEKDGKLYVVKNGKSFEMTVDGLKSQIEKRLIGSTIIEVNSKRDLLHLAKTSGILKGLVFEIEEDESLELF